MSNHKIVNGITIPLTEAEELELIIQAEEYASEAPARVREERDEILSSEVDPIVSNALRWNDMTDAKRTEWTNYRQALLDVPAQAGFPNTITWPTKPE
tara:strand:- start:53 stop:346 length:294 start_codon:yes stop_codon:yes gene_type:complete